MGSYMPKIDLALGRTIDSIYFLKAFDAFLFRGSSIFPSLKQ